MTDTNVITVICTVSLVLLIGCFIYLTIYCRKGGITILDYLMGRPLYFHELMGDGKRTTPQRKLLRKMVQMELDISSIHYAEHQIEEAILREIAAQNLVRQSRDSP